MGFRRDSTRERSHERWVRFNRDLLLRTGIPMVAWETEVNWESFLWDDLSLGVDPSGFSIDAQPGPELDEARLASGAVPGAGTSW